MRAPARTTIIAVLVVGLASLAAAAGAATPPDLSVSDLFTSVGHGTKLAAGVTYQASEFPLALRVTPPDGSWAGAQWKANLFSPEEIEQRHLTCSTSPAVCRPPYYGWAAVGQGGANPRVGPRGVIIIMTGYDRTPSVAATVTSLRTRGHGATYEPAAPAKVAASPGSSSTVSSSGRATSSSPSARRRTRRRASRTRSRWRGQATASASSF